MSVSFLNLLNEIFSSVSNSSTSTTSQKSPFGKKKTNRISYLDSEDSDEIDYSPTKSMTCPLSNIDSS